MPPNRNLPGRNLALPLVQAEPSPESYFNVRNPLRKYRSFSTRWVITAHATTEDATTGLTPEQRQNMKIGEFIGPTAKPTGVVVVNEFSDVRCAVKEIEWETICVGPGDITSSYMSGNLGLFEPHGVNLLAKMHSWSQVLGVNVIVQMIFAARVYFIGHTDENTDELLSGYPDADRALTFFLDDMQIGFTSDGVSYSGSFTTAINGSLSDGAYSPLATLAQDRLSRERAQEDANLAFRSGLNKIDNAKIFTAITQQDLPIPPRIQILLGEGAIVAARRQYNTIVSGSQTVTTNSGPDDLGTTYTTTTSAINLREPIDFTLQPVAGVTSPPIRISTACFQATSKATPAEYKTCADKFAKDVADGYAEQIKRSGDNLALELGLTDSDEERTLAEKERTLVLTGGPKTIQHALQQLQVMLNNTSIALSKEGDTALKYTYKIHCDKAIANYKMDNNSPKTGGTRVGDTPTSERGTDTNPDAISFRPNSRIHEMIKQILSYSTEIAKQTSLIEQFENKPRRRSESKIVRIRTLRQDVASNAPSIIHFFVGLADSAVPKDPRQLSDRAVAQQELEFDYLYSNRYSDVLSFDMSLDIYSLAIQGRLSSATSIKPSTGDAQRDYRLTQSDPTAGSDRSIIPANITPGSPFAEVRAYPEETQQFLYTLSTAAMLSQEASCSFKILGDPYLCWDTMGDVDMYLKLASDEISFDSSALVDELELRNRGYYFSDHHNDPVRVTLNIRYPLYDDKLQNFDIVPFWYGGYYHLVTVKNTFSDSEGFTQTLDSFYPINSVASATPGQPTPNTTDG